MCGTMLEPQGRQTRQIWSFRNFVGRAPRALSAHHESSTCRVLHEMKGLDARYNFHADGAVVRLTSEAAQLLQSRSSFPQRARNRQLIQMLRAVWTD